MEKFQERRSNHPTRRRLYKLDENGKRIEETSMLVDIVRDDFEEQVDQHGTPLTAEKLNKSNWRGDDSVSFAKRQDNNDPLPLPNHTQIYTKANGETCLLAAGSPKPKRIDKDEVGTLVKINGQKFDEIAFSCNPQLQLDRHQEKLNQLAENSARDFSLRPITSAELAHGAATGDRVGSDIARVSQIPTSASQVNARPNNWMPTPTDLGLNTNAQNDARFLRTGSNLGSQVVGVGTLVSFDGGINVLSPGRDSFTTRQPATTGWVQGQMAQSTDAAGVNSMPVASGRIANRGISNRLARADHRHPTTGTRMWQRVFRGTDAGQEGGTITFDRNVLTSTNADDEQFTEMLIECRVRTGVTNNPTAYSHILLRSNVGQEVSTGVDGNMARRTFTIFSWDGNGNTYSDRVRLASGIQLAVVTGNRANMITSVYVR